MAATGQIDQALIGLLAASVLALGCDDAFSAPAGDVAASASVERIRQHVYFLADDDLEGRASGSAGYEKAAAYVEGELQSLGLVPLFGSSHRQSFAIEELVFGRDGWVSFDGATGHHRFGVLEDSLFFRPGRDGAWTGAAEVVYVGLGIHQPEAGWDDYAGLEVEGKCALLIIDTPMEMAADLKPELQNRYADMLKGPERKVRAAAAHGAECVLGMASPVASTMLRSIVRDPERLRQTSAVGIDSAGASELPPTAALSPRAAAVLFEGQRGRAFPGGRPRGFALEGTLRLDSAVRRQRRMTANVGALLPGTDETVADEVIVLSAHLDGQGMRGSTVLNSANDNASAVSALLEAARLIAEIPIRRSVALLFTAAEEDGLLGVEYFLDNPPFPLDKMKLNVNMEMVGKPRTGRRHTFRVSGRIDPGVERLARAAERAVSRVRFNYGFRSDGDGRRLFRNADHVHFFLREIPTLYFWGGGEDYHQPTDDPGRLNLPKVAAMAEVLTAVVQATDRDWSTIASEPSDAATGDPSRR